jgi:hypothetical protein
MSHLMLEAIARLVDEAPTVSEGAHLEGCAFCRQELEDMRADAAALAALPLIEPPEQEWGAIEARLAHEGLMRVPSSRAFAWRGTLLRMAAAIVLFAFGTLAGAAWMRGGPEAVIATQTQDEPVGSRAVAQEPAPMTPLLAESAVPAPVQRRLPEPRQDRPAAAPSIQFASALVSAREPRNPEEAARLMREVEALYYQALIRLAETAPAAESGDPLTRLAVLEGITTLTGTALGQAPADPVLNGYHLAALAQREATLKQIAARTTDSWF